MLDLKGSKIIFLIMSLFTSIVFAHGEDVPGPHGGMIRMPGSFHTELVREKDGSFSVYLLDIQFKNPVVADSEVKASVFSGKKKYNLKCEVTGADHFRCSNEKKIKKINKLVLQVMRNGVKGTGDAMYELN